VTFDLSDRGLSEIPTESGQVTVLNVSRNRIASLAPLVTFHCLTHLDLSHNCLSNSLPTTSFSRLTHLKVLDVSHNRLTSVSAVADCRQTLQILNISNNRLRLLTGVEACSKLQEVRMTHNLLSGTVKSCGLLSFEGLKDLRILDFTDNPIASQDLVHHLRSFLVNLRELNGLPLNPFTHAPTSAASALLADTATSSIRARPFVAPDSPRTTEKAKLLISLAEAISRKERFLRKIRTQQDARLFIGI